MNSAKIKLRIGSRYQKLASRLINDCDITIDRAKTVEISVLITVHEGKG